MKTLQNCGALILLMIYSVNVFSQDSSSKDERTMNPFSSIEASGIAQVYLTKGNEEKVVVDINVKSLRDHVKIKVQGTTLQIKFEDRNGYRNEFNNVKLKVYVTYKSLAKITGSGATTFHTENAIMADKFVVDLSGANNTTLELDVDELDIETSGASNATLSGKANKLHVEASGASNVKAYALKAIDVRAETSGVANANVAADKTININASGLSNINYRGDAHVVTKEVSKMANAHKN